MNEYLELWQVDWTRNDEHWRVLFADQGDAYTYVGTFDDRFKTKIGKISIPVHEPNLLAAFINGLLHGDRL